MLLILWQNEKNPHFLITESADQYGGEGGIRTHVTCYRQLDFESFFAYDF